MKHTLISVENRTFFYEEKAIILWKSETEISGNKNIVKECLYKTQKGGYVFYNRYGSYSGYQQMSKTEAAFFLMSKGIALDSELTEVVKMYEV